MDRRNASPLSLLIGGGLLVGTLDLLFAVAFWAPRGITLVDVLHAIATGWYGKRSHAMGSYSAFVGALSHYLIACAFVLAYWQAARRLPALVRRPWAWGAVYGLALYAAMNFVVLPLSAAGPPGFADTAWVASSIAVHVVIGLLCAGFARRALRR